ncbi:MAG: heme exporter protein CcmD [Bacteroidota bacterium]|nr:heme exporter protein CcmD [Bacteroidota bacterium]
MRKIISILILGILLMPLLAQEKSIPYTQADRDRLVRVETKIEGQDKRFDDMNNRFDDMNKRIDDLNQSMILGFSKADERMNRMESNMYSFFMWGFGIVIMSIMGLIGFIIYDRRTALNLIERKIDEVISGLKAISKINPEIKEALKQTALW